MSNHFKNLILIQCTKLANNANLKERKHLITYRQKSERNSLLKITTSDVTNNISNFENGQRSNQNGKTTRSTHSSNRQPQVNLSK